VKKLNTQIHLH